ncbi:MAG: aldehyde ferredoxin oxidoreductase family protein [Bacillota bacterium]
MHGYAGKVLRVDLSRETFVEEELDPQLARTFLGGRGLNVYRLWHQVPAGLAGLDPANVLVFGVGPFNGTLFPGSGRFNVSAMSPQTGILGDSNAGGFFGAELKFAGYDQLIITGRAPQPVYLWLSSKGPALVPARSLVSLDVWQVQDTIARDTGDPRVQVACTGPAAEAGVKFAGVFCNLVRAAARTGMGAVMASKNLKAVAVRGHRPVTVADGDTFGRLLGELEAEILDHRQYVMRCRLGTTHLVKALNARGCLGTRHYTTGRFEAWEQVSGERLAELYKVKAKACFSCPIPCSRFLRIGALATEGPEFEGLAGFTAMLGCADLRAGLEAVDRCNRYGMDVIATSECIAFVIECFEQSLITAADCDGLTPRWGDTGFMLAMVDKIAAREGIGDILGDGVRQAAQRLGRGTSRLAMHVKGLEFFKADPRGIKGYALGVAVASRGGDHLRSEPSFEFCEDKELGRARYGVPQAAFPLEYLGKGRVVKEYEELCALADCWNACKNTIVNMEVLSFAKAAAFYRALTGLDMDAETLQRACEALVNLERAFIVREGIRRSDDTLPDRFLHEPLPPGSGPSSGHVVELDPMLDEYYDSRGWDRASGVPTPGTLERLGLGFTLDDLRAAGATR